MLHAVPSASARGFTLIEALIVVTMLSILAAIAIPNYSRYVTRGQLVEATNALGEFRVRMEQFYQDNRSYQNAGGGCGAAVPASLSNFAVTCAIAAAGQAYTATATGAANTLALSTRLIKPMCGRPQPCLHIGEACRPTRPLDG